MSTRFVQVLHNDGVEYAPEIIATCALRLPIHEQVFEWTEAELFYQDYLSLEIIAGVINLKLEVAHTYLPDVRAQFLRFLDNLRVDGALNRMALVSEHFEHLTSVLVADVNASRVVLFERDLNQYYVRCYPLFFLLRNARASRVPVNVTYSMFGIVTSVECPPSYELAPLPHYGMRNPIGNPGLLEELLKILDSLIPGSKQAVPHRHPQYILCHYSMCPALPLQVRAIAKTFVKLLELSDPNAGDQSCSYYHA
jgi:hypothetical protein